MKPLLLVFAKSPTPGLVKTRLMGGMSATAAAAVYKRLLSHTLQQAALAAADTVVWRSGDVSHPYWRDWPKLMFCEQPEGDLGQKMAHAIATAMQLPRPVVVVGSDCLALSANYIDEAFSALKQGADLVLGPATDGGYVLIGMNELHGELFEGINWSTDKVLAQTLKQADLKGLNTRCLKPLNDVDTVADAVAAGLFSYR